MESLSMSGGMPFPSMDPAFVGQILAQVLEVQQADHAQLAQAQQAAVLGNPLFQALVGSGSGVGTDASATPMMSSSGGEAESGY